MVSRGTRPEPDASDGSVGWFCASVVAVGWLCASVVAVGWLCASVGAVGWFCASVGAVESVCASVGTAGSLGTDPTVCCGGWVWIVQLCRADGARKEVSRVATEDARSESSMRKKTFCKTEASGQ